MLATARPAPKTAGDRERIASEPCHCGRRIEQPAAKLRTSAGPVGPADAAFGHFTFGYRSSCDRGSFMLAVVIRLAPVSTKASTFSFFTAASAVFTPS